MQTTSNKLLFDLAKGDLIIPSLIRYDAGTFHSFNCLYCEFNIFQIVDIELHSTEVFILRCFCFNCHRIQQLTYYMGNHNFCKKLSYILI